MNRKRLEQAKERLLTVVDPSRFDMSTWQSRDGVSIGDGISIIRLDEDSCGTAGCFAGWLPAMFMGDPELDTLMAEHMSWSTIVQKFFKLGMDQAEFLWGSDMYDRRNGPITPQHVCDHIDILLEEDV